MAEMLGIVASGLAIQDAPDEIQDLMADITCFTELLSEMEGQLVESSPVARQSLQLSRNALGQLEAVVSVLETQLASPKRSKRLMGALKAVIRREDMKRFENKLERAFRLLQMSHQCYISASTKLLPDVIAERMSVELHRYHHERLKVTEQTMIGFVTDAKKEEPPQEDDISDIAIQGRVGLPRSSRSRLDKTWSIFGETFVIKASSDSRSFELAFRPPMIQRIWNIQATQTYGSWQYVFRRRGYVTQQLRDCIEKDDDTGLLQLFELGQGSPYDRDANGDSIFTHAAWTQKFRVMTMLLKSGLVEDSDIQVIYDSSGSTAGDIIQRLSSQERYPVMGGLHGLSDNTGDQVRLLNSMGYQLEWDYAFENIDGMARDRFKIGRWIATRPFSFQFDPETIPLKPPKVETFTYLIDRQYEATDGLIAQSVHSGVSLLGSVAYAFGWTLALSKYESSPLSKDSESEATKWERLAQDIIRGRSDLLHPVDNYVCWSRLGLNVELFEHDSTFFAEWSPLWALFSGAFMTGYRRRGDWVDGIYGAQPTIQMMETALYSVRRWLGLLQACGVDLEVYGTVEKRLISEEQVTKDFEISLEYPIWTTLHCSDGLRGSLRVISLDIGPNPEDWRIWWAFEYEIWAQEFWEMVENTEPELAIPGRWVD
ncbi:hypothetical protein V8F06_007389 [Rhypophila decipiens]